MGIIKRMVEYLFVPKFTEMADITEDKCDLHNTYKKQDVIVSKRYRIEKGMPYCSQCRDIIAKEIKSKTGHDYFPFS